MFLLDLLWSHVSDVSYTESGGQLEDLSNKWLSKESILLSELSCPWSEVEVSSYTPGGTPVELRQSDAKVLNSGLSLSTVALVVNHHLTDQWLVDLQTIDWGVSHHPLVVYQIVHY